MIKIYKIILIFFMLVLLIQGAFIFQIKKEIEKQKNAVEELSYRSNSQTDLSDIESRIDDLENENESLKRKIIQTSTSSDYDAEYETRRLERRISELESKSNY